MNNRHLPAGPAMPGGGGPGTPGGVDMGPGPGVGSRGRRGAPPPPAYPAHYHQQVNQMYNSYMNPYAPAQYYHQQMPPPQYQNGGMQSGYMHYQHQPYARSPPTMQQQYVPMVGVSVPQAYPRPAQQSPARSTPYQPPAAPSPASAPLPPQTPSSTQSSHVIPVQQSPVTQHVVEAPPVAVPAEPTLEPVKPRESFRAPLPWLSHPDVPFPSKATRSRRRRRILAAGDGDVTLPEQHGGLDPLEQAASQTSTTDDSHADASTSTPISTPAQLVDPSTPVPRSETPATDIISEIASVKTSTGASTAPPGDTGRPVTSSSNISSTDGGRPASRPAIPVVPIVPAIPKSSPKDTKTSSVEKAQASDKQSTIPSTQQAPLTAVEETPVTATENAAPADRNTKSAPKLWANLFTSTAPAAPARPQPNGNGTETTTAPPNGAVTPQGTQPANAGMVKFSVANANSLSAAIKAYRVGPGDKLAFLEPRGLINTGNMCYMNSVLQVLLFCVPFYDFLDQVNKNAVHSFKSETPLIDAMTMFMREFRVIDAAGSVDQLRRRLKNEELEQYGEPFIPEFVYDSIKTLPRFAGMRRGHQQDAEEFLGFLLQALDDECVQLMGPTDPTKAPSISSASASDVGDSADGWFEVGSKQRPAVTRSSGASSSSPITRIFGGLLRSELKIAGLKDSITTEPFQPLQLDIGASNIRNIVDALKGLTRAETLHGDFRSPRGKDVGAQKQVLIESLPPVLILHLKRFQFDAEGGTMKIWKKVGYPLELEIPREVLSRQKRNSILAEGAGMPKYRLIGVVYHHGKNASGGHYTVDVRRQDGREWIRLDDTVIRRVRSEDVAEGGAEEESPKESRKEGESRDASVNRYGAMHEEDGGHEEGSFTKVNGNKRWSSVVNGGAAQPKGKQAKDNIKDNKVAYLLFYQRM